MRSYSPGLVHMLGGAKGSQGSLDHGAHPCDTSRTFLPELVSPRPGHKL